MWTEGRVAWLRDYWAAGFSGAQIAKLLGGVTRNAVIGKVHRLGLATRAIPAGATKKPKQRPSRAFRKYKSKAQPAFAPETIAPLQIPLIDLRANQCRAVTDTTKWEQRFCGHPVAFGSPYCGGHFTRFYCVAAAKADALAA